MSLLYIINCKFAIVYIEELISIGSFLMIKRGNNMINVDNLSYSFPQKDLYNKVSFTLEEGQHAAFIGASSPCVMIAAVAQHSRNSQASVDSA